MYYDEKHKILYKISPMAQVAVGRFFGYMLVCESYIFSVKYDKDKHDVRFTYSSLSQWDKLVKYIKEDLRKC